MKRKLLHYSLLTLFMLVVGSGNVWATDVTYKLTITGSDFNTTSYAANNNEKTSQAVCTTDATKKYEVKWTSNQVMKNSSNMQWQKNNGCIYNSTSLENITNVTVTSTAGTFTTYYGAAAQPSSSTTVGGGFFQTKVGNATGTSSKIEVTFVISEPDPSKEDITLSFPEETYNADIASGASSFSAPTLSKNKSASIDVEYSSSNTAVATVNASTGAVTLIKKGSTTITALFAGDATYNGASASYTLNVVNSNANDGSLSKPFTVAEAIDYIEEGENLTEKYVVGTIAKVDRVTVGGNAQYWISDDGVTENQFEVYNGLYLGSTNFTASDQIKVGDVVIVYGNLTYYAKNSVYEFAANNYIYSLNGNKASALTITDGVNGSISVKNGDDDVVSGTQVISNTELTLTATPATGYSFGSWTATAGTLANSTAASTTFTMPNEPATLSATFTLNTYTLDVTSSHGTVAVTVNGEVWNGTDKIPYGATVSMTATPSSTDWTFASWDATLSEFNAASNPLVFTMPAEDVAVEAQYLDASIEYNITINDVTGGTITANKAKAKAGTVITLSYDLTEGYAFDAWTVKDDADNEVAVTENEFTMPASDVTVTATYKKIFKVLYSVAGEETTVDRVDGEELNLPTPATVAGMAFAGWSESNDVKTTPAFVSNTSTVTGDMTLYAFFTAKAPEYSYNLVEAAQTDWRGDYLIAYTSNVTTYVADGRTGGTTGMGKQNSEVVPGAKLNGKVIDASWGDTYHVSLVAIDDNDLTAGYVLKTQDGQYNYQSSNANGLASTENLSTAISHPLSVKFNSSSDIAISISAGAVFHYNTQGYFRFYKDGGQEAIHLYKKTATPAVYSLGVHNITIGDSKYLTYCAEEALNFSGKGVTPYKAAVEVDDVVLTAIDGGIVPAKTGVILVADAAGTFNIPVTTTDATVSDNELVGVTAKTVVPWEADGKYNYILQKDGEGVVKFFKATGASLKANRAYLSTTYDVSAAAARGLNIVFADDMTTGIREKVTVNSEKFATAPVYNLNGQRVSQPTRGLYIVNGKKVVVK